MNQEITQIFDQSKAKHKVIFSDACYSGSLLAMKSSLNQMMRKYYQSFENTRGGLAFLTSSKSEEISLEDGVLHVNGQKKEEKEDSDEGYTRKEFSYNSYRRSLKLPNSINQNEEMKATYEEGILKLNLNKKKDNGVESKKIIKIK